MYTNTKFVHSHIYDVVRIQLFGEKIESYKGIQQTSPIKRVLKKKKITGKNTNPKKKKKKTMVIITKRSCNRGLKGDI